MRRLAFFTSLLFASSCSDVTAVGSPKWCEQTDHICTNGTVRFQSFEGGFWGIIGDDGGRYDPLGDLPTPFRSEGLAVTLTAVNHPAITTHQWGTTIDVVSISKR